MMLIGLFTLVTIGAAQTLRSPCGPPIEVQHAFRNWNDPSLDALPYRERVERRRKMLADLSEKYPGDLSILQRAQDLEAGPMGRDRKAMVESLGERAKKTPDDVITTFLYARGLIGYRTGEAFDLLEKILQNHPSFHPARLELSRIYSFPNRKDPEKAWALVEEVQKGCPDTILGYNMVLRLNDQAALEKSEQRLRKVIEDRIAAGDAGLVLGGFQTLWAIGFRARPTAGYGAARKQVEADLERIRNMQLTKDPQWYEVLRAGYELLGDKEKQRVMQREYAAAFPNSTNAFFQLQREWNDENPFPKLDDPAEVQNAHAKKVFDATEEWSKRWPHQPMVWSKRLSTFRSLVKPSAEVLGDTADRLLTTYRDSPDSFRSFPPIHYQVAEMYLLHKIRLERIPEMFREGTKELEGARDDSMQSDYGDKKEEFYRIGNYSIVYSDGYPMLMDAYLAMKRPEEARKVLTEMEQWLERYKPPSGGTEQDRKTQDFRMALLWEKRGWLAETEGRKADAVACYLSAAALVPKPGPVFRPYRVNPALKAQQLWKELGGTREGLQALNDKLPAKQSETWTPMATPLPDFEITDTNGKRWRLADLKGQRTLVNVWARWCGPCVAELPTVQKLSDRLKERTGYQVITFNVDDNPGVIEPFFKEHKLTLPALPAKEMVDKLVPLLSIPRTWLINPAGVIAFESIGFGFSKDAEDRLISESILKLEQMK